MISFETNRLICKSDLCVEKGQLVKCNKENVIDILNIHPSTGKESGFVFYAKESQTTLVCHIGIVCSRNRFEVSYGVDDISLRSQGYMTEALNALCGWLFNNTEQDVVWALPNGECKEASIKVLEKCDFQPDDIENGLVWYVLKRASL